MDNPQEATEKLRQLKEAGLQIAMDDFGTGFSSLYYLKNFPIDVIKVDRSFIKDIEKDAKIRAIIESIVSLAHNLDLKVTAEGVETEDQLAFLMETSCDFAQGYYFARPINSTKSTQFLQKHVEGTFAK